MGRNREVAGICLDLLYAELVAAVPSRPVLFAIGVQVGLQLTERHTTECRRFADHLEMIKFICKEFWQEVFQKQIDNLKTNRYRVRERRDHRCRPIIPHGVQIERLPKITAI
mmetsp:Transcript_26230/g.49825  ORF Transcript_26230/g.49825 Transcript_26230/m.49825 type:complete len:112 (+) Transcript_26230:141-476(+)